MTDPEKDEHIEELLSKLQGIFGKLSHSEEEEAKQSIDSPAPVDPATNAPAAPIPPDGTGPSHIGETSNPLVGNAYDSTVPLEDPDKMVVPTALFFPPGRETEAKTVAHKLETMTPKFTKVAFRLRVGVCIPYDPKSEWKDAILQKVSEVNFRTAFVLMERPLDDGKRKMIAYELEARGVYFQEVLTTSIEKKAFYTDVLLGLVFFFDSHKPAPGAAEAESSAT